MCQNNKTDQSNLKIYAGFAQAFKKHFEGINVIIDTTTCAIVVKACNLDEAMGKAYNYSKEKYPAKKGYYNHNSDVIRVDHEKP